ncbi:hypothetical protein B0H14DRAFT_2588556 [Mycena olivaceomarginata]|nr:hypothetical protein B0H14DRAFT_2588556 [Mycena olivaceomarginata]
MDCHQKDSNTIGIQQKIIEYTITIQWHWRRNTIHMKPLVAAKNQILVDSMWLIEVRHLLMLSLLLALDAFALSQNEDIGPQFFAQNSEVRRLMVDIQNMNLKVRIYGIYTFIMDINTIRDSTETCHTSMGAVTGSKDIAEDIQRCEYEAQLQADGSEQAQRSEEPANKSVRQAKRGTQNTCVAGNQHQHASDKLGPMGTVAGAELTGLEKQLERRQRDVRFGAKSRMLEIEPSHGRDKTPEATDPEDLIPEAKTQSKNNNGFSRSVQKVDERWISKKVADGDMGEEEKER